MRNVANLLILWGAFGFGVVRADNGKGDVAQIEISSSVQSGTLDSLKNVVPDRGKYREPKDKPLRLVPPNGLSNQETDAAV